MNVAPRILKRERERFYFQGAFLKISVRLFACLRGGFEIMKVVSYFLAYISFSYLKYSWPEGIFTRCLM